MEKTNKRNMRKRILSWMAAVAMVLSIALITDAFSAVYSAAEEGKVTAASVKVRKEASTASDMIGGLKKGDTVTITSSVTGSDGYVWYEITIGDKTGFVRSDLVTKDGTTPDPTPTTEPDIDVEKVQPVIGTVSSGKTVRVRAGASTDSAIVSSAASGLEVTINGRTNGSDGYVWYQVAFAESGNSVTGFIRSDFVQLSGELVPFTQPTVAPTVEPTVAPTPTPTPTPKAYETELKDGDWYLVDTEKNEGYIIEDLFNTMSNNLEEYQKMEKKLGANTVVIVLLVILWLATAGCAVFLFMKLKDNADSKYFKEVERETLNKRSASNLSLGRIMPTVGADKEVKKPAGAPQAGGPKPAQTAQPGGPKPAPTTQPGGPRVAVAPQGGARVAGAPHAGAPRPAGAPQPGGPRPAGAPQPGGPRVAGAPQAGGPRPAGAPQAGGPRPAGAPQAGGPRPAGAPQAARPQQVEQGAPKVAPKPQTKNFMVDDDDFDFKFLNNDGGSDE
jgi:uncharacterized protein YgiM (DUF1202 family)